MVWRSGFVPHEVLRVLGVLDPQISHVKAISTAISSSKSASSRLVFLSLPLSLLDRQRVLLREQILFLSVTTYHPSRDSFSSALRSHSLTTSRSLHPPTPDFGMSKTFTASDVASHNKPGDLYITVDGDVYDLTKFQDDHPGT